MGCHEGVPQGLIRCEIRGVNLGETRGVNQREIGGVNLGEIQQAVT